MSKTFSGELDEDFIVKFFGMTDRMIPDGQEITMAMLRDQLEEIAATLADFQAQLMEANKHAFSSNNMMSGMSDSFMDSGQSSGAYGFEFEDDVFNIPDKSILIIDDLGVITYQLEVLFKQLKFDVVTSRELYDAIEKFKKTYFDVVIMDLFIPTEREGLILLEELKKLSAAKQKPSKIGIMSASSKKEHKQLCKMKGAEFYVEKIDDWQKDLCRMVKELTS